MLAPQYSVEIADSNRKGVLDPPFLTTAFIRPILSGNFGLSWRYRLTGSLPSNRVRLGEADSDVVGS